MNSKKRREDDIYINPKYKKQKSKRVVSSQFLWIVLLIAAAVFFVTFFRLPMFPRKWSWYLLIVLGALLLLTGIASASLSQRNILIKMINVVFACTLAVCSIMLPYYTSVITRLFNSVAGNSIRISLYVMSDMYKEEHPALFSSYISTDAKYNVKDFADQQFITTQTLDEENQAFALKELQKLYDKDVDTMDVLSVQEAAYDLYHGEGDVMVMRQDYESIIDDMEGYENFSQDAKIIYTFVRKIESEEDKIDVKMTKEPFMIFIGGNDQEGDLSKTGRTDVNIVLSVNPDTKQIAIISIPRDSYIPNPAYSGANDKLTHLGMQGIENTMKGLSDYLETDIESYVLINFTTFKQIVDALDGVDVDNPYRFRYTWDHDYVFEEGNIHLDGQAALYYVRERYSLQNGDFDRNMHQQLVLKAIIEKICSPQVITKFNALLSSLNGTFLTNISSKSIYSLCKKQLDEDIHWQIHGYHVIGDTGYEVCASAPGVDLSVVYPDPEQIAEICQVIDDIYAGKEIADE